ncbi:vWA domain-containing protein [Stratiformator vulcanicus]|uniref:VWFA domain-containing protein n=1 Tax=Stratiformator vulcanicus TaxID=2527980 RepID=A0A517QWD0_9PLAN|nr:vWA domain-containing protein [Stratiformator vulcanicus]QDT35883.1 hypothetical protein Pan189_02360 [Stratiformator vulcanicus]
MTNLITTTRLAGSLPQTVPARPGWYRDAADQHGEASANPETAARSASYLPTAWKGLAVSFLGHAALLLLLGLIFFHRDLAPASEAIVISTALDTAVEPLTAVSIDVSDSASASVPTFEQTFEHVASDSFLPTAPSSPFAANVGAQATLAGVNLGSLVGDAGGTTGSGGAAKGKSKTSFFGIEANGKHFAFIVDRSGSMSTFNAIYHAKKELIRAIGALGVDSRYDIVFYNHEHVAVASPQGSETLRASFKEQLPQQINAVLPFGGTNPMPALRVALKRRPDVVFFLTDANFGLFDRNDLMAISNWNEHGSTIHCIRFKTAENTYVDSLLNALSVHHGGRYNVVDLRQIGLEWIGQ